MFRLDNKVAVVTGGAQGIGKAICQIFSKAGATVFIWDVLDKGNDVEAEIKTKGGSAFFQKVDVTNSESVQSAISEILSKSGKIDILINNAGIIRDRSFLKMSSEEWNSVINVNLNALFTTTQAILPHMKNGGYGRIINASSVNGSAGAFGQTNYAATKAGVQGFTRSLCKEVGKYNITVNCVAPGFIKTEMTAGMPEEVIQAGIQMIPIRRVGTPEDMAYTYLFLASEEAGFVNGITLHANGGAYPT